MRTRVGLALLAALAPACGALASPDGAAVNEAMRAHDVTALKKALDAKAAALRQIIERPAAQTDNGGILRQLQRSRVATNDVERAARRLLGRDGAAGLLADDAAAQAKLSAVEKLLESRDLRAAIDARHNGMDRDDLERSLAYDKAALAALKPLFEKS